MWILIYSFSGTYYVWVACETTLAPGQRKTRNHGHEVDWSADPIIWGIQSLRRSGVGWGGVGHSSSPCDKGRERGNKLMSGWIPRTPFQVLPLDFLWTYRSSLFYGYTYIGRRASIWWEKCIHVSKMKMVSEKGLEWTKCGNISFLKMSSWFWS